MLAIGAQCGFVTLPCRRTAICRQVAAQRCRSTITCSSKDSEYTSPPKYSSPGDYNVLRTGSEPAPIENMEVSRNAPPPNQPGPGSYQSPGSYQQPTDYSIPSSPDISIGGGGGKSGGGSGGGGGGDGSGSSGSGGSAGGSGPWRLLTVLFAAFIAASGWNAYQQKGSQASLTASGTIAAALLLSVALMNGSTRVPATLLALATSLTLGAYMGKGYARSRKPFPQGVFLGISLILSAGYTSTLL